MTYKTKVPWATKDVMTQIYDRHFWGGKEFDFYSGYGSHNNKIVKPYLNAVINFLKSFKKPLTVCDLGCGDFNIGQHLTSYTQTYLAIDIVEDLINRNKDLFKANNLEFQCLDISKQKWPSADCVILRNVLQHLSNAEIQAIIKKLENYKYIILTEHIPIGDFTPNADIISGQGIRLKKQSGVNLLEAPFNLKVKKQNKLVDYVLENGKEKIETILYEM